MKGPVEPGRKPCRPCTEAQHLALGGWGWRLSPTFLPTSHSALISTCPSPAGPWVWVGAAACPSGSMMGAFRTTLVPGAGWQEAEPLRGLWERQSQMGSRAGGCRPQAGPGETGRTRHQSPRLQHLGRWAGTMQEPRAGGSVQGAGSSLSAGSFPQVCMEGRSTCIWGEQPQVSSD